MVVCLKCCTFKSCDCFADVSSSIITFLIVTIGERLIVLPRLSLVFLVKVYVCNKFVIYLLFVKSCIMVAFVLVCAVNEHAIIYYTVVGECLRGRSYLP